MWPFLLAPEQMWSLHFVNAAVKTDPMSSSIVAVGNASNFCIRRSSGLSRYPFVVASKLYRLAYAVAPLTLAESCQPVRPRTNGRIACSTPL